jgi:hypothetical protein
VIHGTHAHRLAIFSAQFDRTRLSIAVQAQMTRASIAHEAELLQALVRIHAESTAAALAEQSRQTRSLLLDLNGGHHLESEPATGREVIESAQDEPGYLGALRRKLHGPLTAAEIIGACKVVCAQLPEPEKVRDLLDAHRRDSFKPAALLAQIIELVPDGRNCLCAGAQNLVTQFRLGCRDDSAERISA